MGHQPAPTFDEIFAVMSAASRGDTKQRVSIPDDPPPDNLATQIATALNLLLDSLNRRITQAEATHHITQTELENLIAERTQQLRASEDNFSKAFHASPAAISIATLPEGRWIEINEALAKMVGYTREELIGRTSIELGLVDAMARAKILEAIQTHGRVRNVEIQMQTKSKEMVDVLLSVEEIEINGRPCALAIQYDITELKRAEREIWRLNEDLRHRQNALEATNKELEAFSYSAAHDLRAPLRAIDGFSQVILESYADKMNADGQEYLQSIRRSAQQMAQLIDGLLMLSRVTRTELNREPINLAILAKFVMAQLREQEPDRKVEVEIADPLMANADSGLMMIVMENLLGNAWKYTRKRPISRIEVDSQAQDGQMVYVVRDNGAGFDMQYADKLFAAFQRLHSTFEFEGTGIGLATVQRIIHRHGGHIWVAATVDQGATFYFTLHAP